jgi:tRNA threonylcarbamoyl adenosine modification protein YeaZ
VLLAFDTATPAVTVALWGARGLLAEQASVDGQRQGEVLAAAIARVLAQAGADRRDLTAVVAGTGPGPYTGLRAGLVTARVLGSALGIPAYGICSLDVIAQDAALAAGGREFLVATDARRREVYWARYSATGGRLAGPAAGAPASLDRELPVAGEAAYLYPDLLGEPIPPRYPGAAALAARAAAELAAGRPLPPPEPLYLRRPDARVPGPPKRVTPA